MGYSALKILCIFYIVDRASIIWYWNIIFSRWFVWKAYLSEIWIRPNVCESVSFKVTIFYINSQLQIYIIAKDGLIRLLNRYCNWFIGTQCINLEITINKTSKTHLIIRWSNHFQNMSKLMQLNDWTSMGLCTMHVRNLNCTDQMC